MTGAAAQQPAVATFKIFISSPSDVAEERKLAVQILTQLQRRPLYQRRVKIDVVFWDDEAAPIPFASDADAQASVDIYKGKASNCDLVLCLLWSRLGTPTTQQGKEYPSGTAYEIAVALGAKVPVLFYRRQQDPPYAGKPADVQCIAAEAQRLDEYVAGLRVVDGQPPHFHGYVLGRPAEADAKVQHFEAVLRGHLEHWLETKLKQAEPAGVAGPQARMLPDNIPPRGVGVFVERERELEQLRRPPGTAGLRLIAVVGPSGVGKSELSAEHARTRRADYPGGVYRITFVSGGAPDGLAALAHDLVAASRLEGLKLADQCLQALMNLPKLPCLLIYDNVPDQESVNAWLPPENSACDLLVSSTFLDFHEGWQRVQLAPFQKPQALRLIQALAGDTLAEDYGDDIDERTQGLPIELCALTRAVKTQVERGRRVHFDSLSPDTEQSFASVWSLLEPDARLLVQVAALFQPERVPELELQKLLADHHGWSTATYEENVKAAMDRATLLPTGEADTVKLHALFCEYVREQQGYAAAANEPVNLLRAHAARFSEVSYRCAQNPADASLASLLACYPSRLAFWTGHPDPIQPALDSMWIGEALRELGHSAQAHAWFVRSVECLAADETVGGQASLRAALHQVGICLSEQGEHVEARRWFERAVEAARQGDAHSQVDHAFVGRSQHQVGMCLYDQGEYAEARGWFERAVEEVRQGDAYGRVDHDAVGKSQHTVGMCVYTQGEDGQARAWFERAVEEIRQGDVHARVDHHALGKSQYQVGMCLYDQGEYAEARDWFERAVEQARQGDVYGRVDHDLLGTSLQAVGLCLYEQGEYLESRGWYERAAAEMEQGNVHGRVDRASLQLCREGLETVRCRLEEATDA